MEALSDGCRLSIHPRAFLDTVRGCDYFYCPHGYRGVTLVYGQSWRVLNELISRRDLTVGQLVESVINDQLNRPEIDLIISNLVGAGVLRVDSRTEVEKPTPKSKQFTIWMQMTDQCNLACIYCYINKRPESVSPATARETITSLAYSVYERGYDKLLVKLEGGEPMLNSAAVYQLLEGSGYHREVAVRFHMITNGTNCPGRLMSLAQAGRVGLTLSLDGVREDHDRQRPFRTGRGSFVRINRTIDTLLDRNIRANVLCVVTNSNADHLKDLAVYCLERKMPLRLGLYKQIEAGYRVQFDTRFVASRLVKFYQWLIDNPPRLPLVSYHGFCDWRTTGPRVRNCGAAVNSLAVATDGTLAPCQYILDRTFANIGDKQLINKMGQIDFARQGYVNSDHACRSCRWSLLCGGGCPLHTEKVFGHPDHRSPYCGLFRKVLPYFLKAHASQLINFRQEKQ